MSTVKDYINEMICDIKEGKVIGTGGETFDFLKYMRSNPNSETPMPSGTTGCSYDYNVEIPVWGIQ